jgi:hypothetical protein
VSAFLDCVSCLFSSINRFFFLALPKKGQPMSASFPTIATFFAALMTAVLAVGSASAGVVYGNLGPTVGTNSIGTAGITLSSTTWRAVGFTPGGTNLVLNTATIGLNVNSAGPADVRLDLYSDNSGTPGSSLFNTSQTLAASTLNQPITFNVNQTLTAGTSYWIVAQQTGGSGVLSWRNPSPVNLSPTTQNSSGWTNLGSTTGTTSNNAGGTWGSTGNGSSSAISLDAVPVPEPSMLAMLIGVAIPYAGWRIKRLRG